MKNIPIKLSKKIILFYKKLIIPGGAERLFIQEYKHFTQLGYEVFVITYELDNKACFGFKVPEKNLIIIRTKYLKIIQLAREVKKLGNPVVICSSGDIDIYLASKITKFNYVLHIHHPCFMSYNDYDKYSIFVFKYFKKYVSSNYGAKEFLKIKKTLSIKQLINLNIKYIFSLKAKQSAKLSLVLSKYAKKEKLDLYNISCEVIYGAIENSKIKKITRTKSKILRIITVARLDLNKRIDELLKSLLILKYKKINFSLVIIGEGPERKKLEKLTHELGINKNVKFEGFVSDDLLINYYKKADIFASIDWADYKLSMFESLLYGIPVIVSNETEVSNKFINKGYITIVKPNARDLAKKFEGFTANKFKFNVNEAEEFLEEFTWNQYFMSIATKMAELNMISSPAKTKTYH